MKYIISKKINLISAIFLIFLIGAVLCRTFAPAGDVENQKEVVMQTEPIQEPPEIFQHTKKDPDNVKTVFQKPAQELEMSGTNEAESESESESVPETTLTTEPTKVQAAEKRVCSLTVRCDSVLEKMENLPRGKAEFIPVDGIMYHKTSISFSEGESVFDVLYREMRDNKIHFEFVNTPMYDSAYIEGIGNLYEFDFGELSGWLYQVNGVRPTHGCSQQLVQNGDAIEFFYSCNFLEE